MKNLRQAKMFQSILLIDDSEVELQLTTGIIEHIGLSEQVVQRNSVLTAINYLQELIEKQHAFPEIIMIDSHMPVLNGQDFLDIFDLFDPIIKKNCQIIILIQNAEVNRIEILKTNKNVSAVIDKPINCNQLESALEIIQEKRLQRIGQWLNDFNGN